MEPTKIVSEIQSLENEIAQWCQAATTMDRLTGETIDRPHSLDLWELSDRELDGWMGDQLSRLNEDVDPRPLLEEISSHRRFIGPVIVFFKRMLMKALNLYTSSILERQRRFNQETLAFQLASYIRIRRIQSLVDTVTRQLSESEELQSISEYPPAEAEKKQ